MTTQTEGTNMADNIVEQALTSGGVFKGAHGLRGLAEARAFWDKQAYGTRLYYGDGIADYLHHGVLTAAIKTIETQADELDRLRTKLECRADGGPDGIDCRNETIKGQDATIDRLRTELASARVDAARFRFMRKNIDDSVDPDDGSGYYWHNHRGEFEFDIDEDGEQPSFEQVIDAAISQVQP